jgi:hypothetical protein
VSHETIYRSLFVQARGLLKKVARRAKLLPVLAGFFDNAGGLLLEHRHPLFCREHVELAVGDRPGFRQLKTLDRISTISFLGTSGLLNWCSSPVSAGPARQ